MTTSMTRKLKTVPKDFKQLLHVASQDEAKDMFAKCEFAAWGGFNQETAMGYWALPRRTDRLAG